MRRKFKRLLALIMALCMVMSFVTVAHADSKSTSEGQNDSFVSDHVALPEREVPGKSGLPGSVAAEGGGFASATVTPSEDPGIDLANGLVKGPDALGGKYRDEDIVHVIVVFSEDSLFDQGFSAEDIQAGGENVANAQTAMAAKQDMILAQIRGAVADAVEEKDIPTAAAQPMEINYRYGVIFNGASLSVPFGALDAIRGVSGVQDAFVAKTYRLPEDIPGNGYEPYTYAASGSTGAALTWEAGYKGEGMRIAIIDTGLDVDHPSFSPDDFTAGKTALTEAEIAQRLPEMNAKKAMSGVTAEDLYQNAKVPFTFNYADGDLDVSHEDGQGDHGTHVAGITAANKIDSTDVVGVAPNAQIIVMRVFGASGGAQQDDIAAALEDCFYLGVDVANMSLGSDAGFSVEWEDSLYASIAEHGMILAVAAGNSTSSAQGNLNGQDKNKTSDPDNSIISSPATYKGVTAVASSENTKMMLRYFELGQEQIGYSDSGEIPFTTLVSDESGRQAYPYVVIPGVGDVGDYTPVEDVIGALDEDWIALVQRGSIDFTTKQQNAYHAGAAGVIVYDNVAGELSNMQDAGIIPNVFITNADGLKMVNAASNSVGTITLNSLGEVAVDNPIGGLMSSFSSWGVSPDLTLTPDITAPGGHIFSTRDNGTYGDMSGTSMATPEIAGMSALVLQYLDEIYPALTTGGASRHDIAEALLMSTATPIVEKQDGGRDVPYSPRNQGAGLANVYKAVTSPAYLTVDTDGADGVTPKASLGDSSNGTYEFTFKINNLTDEELTYTLSSTLLTDECYQVGGVEYMGETSRLLTDSAVTFSGSHVSGSTVTVPASGTEVMVNIALGTNDMAYMDAHYENGIYVDGFVRLTHSEGDGSSVDLSLPFVGFYGDWSAAPLFDEGWMYEAVPSGEKYYTNAIFGNYLMGANPYTGQTDRIHFVTSPNNDGYYDSVDAFYVGQMRSARKLVFSWKDAEGNLLTEAPIEYEYAKKTTYNASYGFAIPTTLYTGYNEMYDFTDRNGEPLKDGDVVYLTVEGYLEDGDDIADDILVEDLPIYVDTTGPKVEVVGQKDGKLTLAVTDNTYVAAIMPLDATGSGALAYYTVDEPADAKPGQTYTVEIDLTGFDSTFQIAVSDYGMNETYVTVSLEDEPSFDPNAWYVYRYYSWLPTDYGMTDTTMYNGWWTFTGSDAASMAFRDSTLLTAAADVTAAEYVDGYIIGIEQTGTDDMGASTPANIFAIKPGSWTRLPIGTLDLSYTTTPASEWEEPATVYLNAVDMTFDHANNKLYVLTQADDKGAQKLLTVDPNDGKITSNTAVTGRTELLTLAADKTGTLYTIDTDAENATLYKLSADGTLTAVGQTGVATGFIQSEYDWETGAPVETLNGYFQTMAFNHAANETLYWASYNTNFDAMTYETAVFSGIYTVDTAAGAAKKVSDVLYDGELTGLVKVYDDEDDSTVITDTALIGLTLTAGSLAMKVGDEALVSVIPEPFNASMEGLTWTTSDGTVAAVKNGVITAAGAGTATITASVGDVKAECEVAVVAPHGDLRVFDAAGLFQWIKMDGAKERDDEVMLESISPSYAITAAAYRSGKVYAYDASGSFYALDVDTMNGSKLGQNTDGMITAMAFNYADGYMYGLKETTVGDGWFGYTVYSLARVNIHTGATEDVAELNFSAPYLGMAIDLEGNFYFVALNDMTYNYVMYKATLEDGTLTGEPCSPDLPTGNTGYGSLVYSAENQGFFWANDLGQLYFFDKATYTPVYLGSVFSFELEGMSMCMGLVEIPVREASAPSTPAASAAIDKKYTVLKGGAVSIPVDVEPWNATSSIAYKISDTSIATVSADGVVTGVSVGKTTLTVRVDGLDAMAAYVEVVDSGSLLHGMAMQDYQGNPLGLWLSFQDSDPTAITVDNGDLYDTTVSVCAGAYNDGVIYAYVQIGSADETEYHYYIASFDTNDGYRMETLSRVSWPIRDMAFDYTTGALYAVCSSGEDEGALLQIDTKTGKTYLVGAAGIPLVAVTADKDGQLYAISEDGTLYFLGKNTGSVKEIGPTGLTGCNGYQSMHYDLNTGNTYWTYTNLDAPTGGLYIVDLTTGRAQELGSIDTGMMFGALYTVPGAGKLPAVKTPDPTGVVFSKDMLAVAAGGTVKPDVTVLPLGANSALTWKSADETIAAVDANGVITGVKAGSTAVTATDSKGHTASCVVTVTPAARVFFAYDETNTQWVKFDENGTATQVRDDLENEKQLKVSVYVPEKDTIYAFDAEGGFYSINPGTFERTALGSVEFDDYDFWDGTTYDVIPVDMTYDASADTLYLTASAYSNDPDNGFFFAYGYVYEVDQTSGRLTAVYEGEEPAPANLIAVNGTLYTIDCFDTGMFTRIHPDTQTSDKLSIVTGYWSEPTSSRSFFVDELTGTIYAVRDFAGGGMYGNGNTPEPVLYTFDMGDAGIAEVMHLGKDAVLNGVFLRSPGTEKQPVPAEVPAPTPEPDVMPEIEPEPDPVPAPMDPTPAPVPTPAAPDVTTVSNTRGGKTATETTATPGATVNNGAATSTVSDAMGDEIVRQAAANNSDTVVIAPKISGSVTKTEVNIPGKTLAELADKTGADVRVETPVADVTIPHAALAELGTGKTVTVTAEKKNGQMTIEVAVDGKSVDSIHGGIRAAFELGEGQVAVLVNAGGSETVIPKSLVEDGMTYVVLTGSASVKIISSSKDFADVSGGDWFDEAVAFAASHELFNGVSDTSFAPNSSMTRAMMATVLWRLENKTAADGTAQYPDILPHQWYSEAVAWASESGVVKGYDTGDFGTDDPITREQLAVMLYRYADLQGVDSAAAPLTDYPDAADVSDWAEEAMSWAVGTGLIQGTGSGLDPAGTATRAQVATVLQRLVKLIVK